MFPGGGVPAARKIQSGIGRGQENDGQLDTDGHSRYYSQKKVGFGPCMWNIPVLSILIVLLGIDGSNTGSCICKMVLFFLSLTVSRIEIKMP